MQKKQSENIFPLLKKSQFLFKYSPIKKYSIEFGSNSYIRPLFEKTL